MENFTPKLDKMIRRLCGDKAEGITGIQVRPITMNMFFAVEFLMPEQNILHHS